jgi:four helix bundle protein
MNIAQASLEEVKYYLILSKDLGYLAENEELSRKADVIGKLLYKFVGATSK